MGLTSRCGKILGSPRAIQGGLDLSLGAPPITLVADLLNPNTGGWDEALVRDLFQKEDAKAILSISICEGMEDNFCDRRLGRDAASSKGKFC